MDRYKRQLEQQYESLSDRLRRLDSDLGGLDKLNDNVVGATGTFAQDTTQMAPGVNPQDIADAGNRFAGMSIATRQGMQADRDSIAERQDNTNDKMMELFKWASENSRAERELALKEGEGTTVDDLLATHKLLKDQGKSTASIDKQLKMLGIEPAVEEISKENQRASALIDEIKGINTKGVTGYLGGTLKTPLNDLPGNVSTQAKMDQLTSLLALDVRKLLKGQGTITDNETNMLKDSVGAIKPGMSDDDYKKELHKIQLLLGGMPANKVTEEMKKYKSKGDGSFDLMKYLTGGVNNMGGSKVQSGGYVIEEVE